MSSVRPASLRGLGSNVTIVRYSCASSLAMARLQIRRAASCKLAPTAPEGYGELQETGRLLSGGSMRAYTLRCLGRMTLGMFGTMTSHPLRHGWCCLDRGSMGGEATEIVGVILNVEGIEFSKFDKTLLWSVLNAVPTETLLWSVLFCAPF